MNMSNVTGIILTSVVVILLVGVVVLPTIAFSSDTEYEDKDNEGYAYKMKRDQGTSFSLTIESDYDAGSGHYTIDGQAVTLTGSDSRLYLFDNGGVYMTATASWVWSANFSSTTMHFAFDRVSATGGQTPKVVFSGGTMSVYSYADPTTVIRESSYSWVLHPDTSGDLGLYTAAGFSVTSGTGYYAFFFDGNYHAGLGYGTGASMSKLVGHAGTAATYTVDATLVGHSYEVAGVSIAYGGDAVTTTGYIAPLTYEGVVDKEATPLQMIVSVIPVVLIVSVIIMALGHVMRRD